MASRLLACSSCTRTLPPSGIQWVMVSTNLFIARRNVISCPREIYLPVILSTPMMGLILSMDAIKPRMWLIRPPWIKYFKTGRVKTPCAFSRILQHFQDGFQRPTLFQGMQCGLHLPAKGQDRVIESRRSRALPHHRRPARAASSVPLNPDEMWIERISVVLRQFPIQIREFTCGGQRGRRIAIGLV